MGFAALLLVVGAGHTMAAPPWAKMVLFKHLEADPNEMYPINDSNGPWMILAASFSGEGAEEQAQQLIYELRKDYKLPAYSYQKKFEFSKPVEGKGLTPQGERKMMRYQRAQDYFEIAVMVGDYQMVDDPEAQKVLKKLKHARPKALAAEERKSTNQSLAGLRALQRQVQESMLPKESDELKRGPMANAFVVTNPILPSEYFVPKGLDKFVIEMNKGVPHSLLDCKGRYTVRVATFTGHAVILDKKRQDMVNKGAVPKSYLEDAAKSAHLMAEELCKKGYDAYEFHDRGSSIVTVGSFDSVGTQRGDGKIEINPRMLKIIKQFGAGAEVTPGGPAKVGEAKKVAGIPLDVQPVPVEVPRATFSNAYARATPNR